jgi:hypothetical protein
MRHAILPLCGLLLLPCFSSAQQDESRFTPKATFYLEAGLAVNRGASLPPPENDASSQSGWTNVDHFDAHDKAGRAFRCGIMAYPVRYGEFSLGAGFALMSASYKGEIGKSRQIVYWQPYASTDTSYFYDVVYRYTESLIQVPVMVRYNFLEHRNGFLHAEAGVYAGYILKIRFRGGEDTEDSYRSKIGTTFGGGIFYNFDRENVQPSIGLVAQQLAGSTELGRKPLFVGIRIGIGAL